jgi:hypothetical protein
MVILHSRKTNLMQKGLDLMRELIGLGVVEVKPT